MPKYSDEDKAAFKAKDERISRTAAFNNLVAVAVAAANIHAQEGDTETAKRILNLDSLMSTNEVVFNYLWSGKEIKTNKSVEKPKRRGRPKKKESNLPECTDQQAEILEAIHAAVDSMSIDDVKIKIIEKYGRYPNNTNSINKVVKEISNG